MKIYIDSDFHCHTTNPDGVLREVETDFFEDGTCSAFIEGFCYDDSKGYTAIYPWESYAKLDAAQRKYEQKKLKEYEEALKVVGVTE